MKVLFAGRGTLSDKKNLSEKDTKGKSTNRSSSSKVMITGSILNQALELIEKTWGSQPDV